MSAQNVALKGELNYMFAVRLLEDDLSWFLGFQFQFTHLIEARGEKPAPHSTYSARQRKIEEYQRQMAAMITLAPGPPAASPEQREPSESPPFPILEPSVTGWQTDMEEEELMRLLDEGF